MEAAMPLMRGSLSPLRRRWPLWCTNGWGTAPGAPAPQRSAFKSCPFKSTVRAASWRSRRQNSNAYDINAVSSVAKEGNAVQYGVSILRLRRASTLRYCGILRYAQMIRTAAVKDGNLPATHCSELVQRALTQACSAGKAGRGRASSPAQQQAITAWAHGRRPAARFAAERLAGRQPARRVRFNRALLQCFACPSSSRPRAFPLA
ncbi:hypothetical protein PF003_g36852 [Phytophthora fragariae]|nr:hypothetical protein PF003_g36852 [Phytophthora fragariae]